MGKPDDARVGSPERKAAQGARWRYDPIIVAVGAPCKSPGYLHLPCLRTAMTNIEELKSTGLKATLPRLKILEVFQNAKQRHMTAEDVFRVLLEERSDIGLATVYRVLMQFEQAGLITRSNFESGKAVYELNEGQHHDHLVCLDCGRVEEFFDAEIEKRQQMVAKARGFTLQEHALSLYANCSKTDCPHRTAAGQR
jgi:Fur family ferric uptake transcriptional regulator